MPSKRKNSKMVRKRYNKPFKLPLYRGISNIKSIAPGRMVVTLPYADTVTLDTTGAGIPALWQFRANSCYDPDASFTGHQPRGFDEYMAFYVFGRVIKSEITATAIVQTGTTVPSTFALAVSTVSTIKSPISILECAREQHKHLGAPNGGHDGATLKAKWYSTENYPKEYMPENSFTSSSDAQQEVYYHIQLQPMVQTAQIKADVQVKILYTVELFDVREPNQS